MSGFGVAYDAAVRTLVAQERIVGNREARHLSRSQGFQDQMMYDLLVDECPNDHGIYLERDELVRSVML